MRFVAGLQLQGHAIPTRIDIFIDFATDRPLIDFFSIDSTHFLFESFDYIVLSINTEIICLF